jgi:ribosome-binding factor A
MKQTKRTRQVSDVIRSEIADLLRREIRDPDLGFVTISEVEVSTDLKIARIYISVLGNEEAKEKSFAVLERSRGHLRRLLGGRIHLRLTPELEFRPDTAIDRGSRVEEILAEVLPKQRPMDAAQTDDEEGDDE